MSRYHLRLPSSSIHSSFFTLPSSSSLTHFFVYFLSIFHLSLCSFQLIFRFFHPPIFVFLLFHLTFPFFLLSLHLPSLTVLFFHFLSIFFLFILSNPFVFSPPISGFLLLHLPSFIFFQSPICLFIFFNSLFIFLLYHLRVPSLTILFLHFLQPSIF